MNRKKKKKKNILGLLLIRKINDEKDNEYKIKINNIEENNKKLEKEKNELIQKLNTKDDVLEST